MNNLKKVFLIGVSALLLVSCGKEEKNDSPSIYEQMADQGIRVQITATNTGQSNMFNNTNSAEVSITCFQVTGDLNTANRRLTLLNSYLQTFQNQQTFVHGDRRYNSQSMIYALQQAINIIQQHAYSNQNNFNQCFNANCGQNMGTQYGACPTEQLAKEGLYQQY